LGLAVFVVIHLAGNLLLFVGHHAYNAYAHHLEQLGPVLWTVELGLLVIVLLHATVGVHIFMSRMQARPNHYTTYTSRGLPSLQSLSSRTMMATGSVLGAFLLIHLMNFKFGTSYVTEVEGQPVRDLARLVVEKFQQPTYAFGYSGVMVLLGIHLRHGLWSLWQSLGTMAQPWRMGVYGLSLGGAIVIATGFLVLPLSLYFHLLT
jgi:succinate dehydrogenase / fumarate reductase cytochrome b subunit